MRPGYDQSPINPLPAIIWLISLPIIASEALFGLASMGLMGQDGVGMRLIALQRSAFAPEILERMVTRGQFDLRQAARLLTYPFIHTSLTHAAFVLVFTLALGKMVAEQIRAWAVLAIFLGAAIGGAVVYTLVGAWLPAMQLEPLMGGYPAVYGLVGAFTFLLWVRLGQAHANQLRAFSLIGFLLAFQLIFGLLVGGQGHGWIAEIAGFVAGFALSFVLISGGPARLRRHLQRR